MTEHSTTIQKPTNISELIETLEDGHRRMQCTIKNYRKRLTEEIVLPDEAKELSSWLQYICDIEQSCLTIYDKMPSKKGNKWIELDVATTNLYNSCEELKQLLEDIIMSKFADSETRLSSGKMLS